MKTEQEIQDARAVVRNKIEAVMKGDLQFDIKQFSLLSGILVGLVWVMDGKHCNTMNDLLAGRPLAERGRSK